MIWCAGHGNEGYSKLGVLHEHLLQAALPAVCYHNGVAVQLLHAFPLAGADLITLVQASEQHAPQLQRVDIYVCLDFATSHLCLSPSYSYQMNALLEPWEDEALSEDASWGVTPALRQQQQQQQQQAEALTDTAGSAAVSAAAVVADGSVVGAADGAGGAAAATAAGGAADGATASASGLAALAPGQELDLGTSYRGPKVGLPDVCSQLVNQG